MSTTFADLISDVESELYSFTQGNDPASWLTVATTTTATTLTVDDASIFNTGFAEITSSLGNELVYVVGHDEGSNTVTLAPWGRNQRSTTAYAHPINSRIVANPQFPRSRIAQFINEAVSDTYPALFRVNFTDISLSNGVQVYNLPDEADGLIDAQVQRDLSPESGWLPLRRLAIRLADRTIDIGGAARSNYTLRVTYRCAPKPFVNLTDTLDSIGYGDQVRPVIRIGAVIKGLNGLQGQRLQLAAVESAAMAQLRQPDYLNNAIKTAYAQYQIALQAQQDRLRQMYPPLRYRLP